MQEYFENIIETLQENIRELSMEIDNPIVFSELAIKLSLDTLSELKKYVLTNPFQNIEDEIWFFKNIKPKILSKLIYHNSVFRIETKKPNGGEKIIRKYYEAQLAKLKNYFENNTTGIFLDGATKIDFYSNNFEDNGWGMKINSNCLENRVWGNNFINNVFDVSTNGTLVMNDFRRNFWDKYEGYDLNKDKMGDVPFHPLSLYAVLIEQNPSVMLLFRTFFVDLMDRTEKIIPSLTPESFVDNEPAMKKIQL